MSAQEIAALTVAITGALAAVFAGVRNLRGDRFRNEVASSAATLAGYNTWVEGLQKEIDRLRADAAEDRAALAAERAQFREDMTRLRAEHRNELRVAYERIDDLGSQVYVLQHRPQESRDRREDQ